jgi:hypothetical protein
MSKYTTEVRFICETAAGLRDSAPFSSVNDILQKAAPKVFDFDFPIFDESYRNVLETKILRHYYTREIGLETVGLWKLKLETKLTEIMPFYNQLYKSELLTFNPFYDVDLTRDHKMSREKTAKQTGIINTNEDTSTDENSTLDSVSDTDTNTTTSSSSVENTGASKQHYDKYSDTPQGSLTNVQNDTYLTNARMINDTDTQTGNATVSENGESKGNVTSNTAAESNIKFNRNADINSTNDSNVNTLDDYVEHIKGKNGETSYSSLLKEFRETFINIDMMIINDLSELFFNLW